MNLPWHLYLMAILYIVAGINHFRVPRLYLKIIPPYFPKPKTLNLICGGSEIVLGAALCIPMLTKFAAWGIIALLIAVFPANIYMYLDDNASLGIPSWLRLIRLPLQLGLIWWAYIYT